MTGPSDLLTALRRFGLENDRLDARVARLLNAGAVEFKAMDHLHEAGELTPKQLGDRLALTSGAVTALVDRLERHGWVERAPHETDRRSIVIRPARTTKAEGPQIYAPFAQALRRAAARLSPDERAATIAFLDEASAAAREQAGRLAEPR